MQWGSFLSKRSRLEDAVDECVKRIMKSSGPGAAPTLAIVFISAAFGSDFEDVVPLLREKVPSLKHVVGCSVSTHNTSHHTQRLAPMSCCWHCNVRMHALRPAMR